MQKQYELNKSFPIFPFLFFLFFKAINNNWVSIKHRFIKLLNEMFAKKTREENCLNIGDLPFSILEN
jgi:hypothetical protein